MKMIAVVAYVLVFIGQAQVHGAPSGADMPKAMLQKLIAPDKSEHLLLGTAHRLGLRLEQLPEVVGAVKQSNILIGELSPPWNRQQRVVGTRSIFSGVEKALSMAIAQLDKDGQEGGIEQLRKLQEISKAVKKVGKLKNDPNQLNDSEYLQTLLRDLKEVGDVFLPPDSVEVTAEGEASVDIGGTNLDFNPSNEAEFMVVQLLATALPDLVKVFLTKQDMGETVTFIDPELSPHADQHHPPTVGQLEEEYQHKLRNILQQYDSLPFINLMSLTLEHQQIATVRSALISIALSEARKDYSDFLQPNAAVSFDFQIRAMLGKSEHIALEEPEELQQAINKYYAEASEHFHSLDNFIGSTENMKKLIDRGSLDAEIRKFKAYYATYLKGDIVQASKLYRESTFDPYLEDILIDGRNVEWMNSGKIQQHCTKDNKCLVYAGFTHFLRGKKPLFKLLQETGFKVEKLNAEERDELIAVSSSDTYEFKYNGHQSSKLSLLDIARQGEVELTQHQLNEALLEAVLSGELAKVKWVIEQGVDGKFIGQALVEAVAQEHGTIAELLVNHLPEDDADRVVSIAAHIAALQGKKGKIRIVELLVSKGANDFNDYLLSAAYGGNIAVVEYFLAQGADDIEGGIKKCCV